MGDVVLLSFICCLVYCGLRSLLKVLPLALVGRQEGLYKREYAIDGLVAVALCFAYPLVLSVPVNFLISTPDIDERISITPAKFKSTR